jgi:hypothetical protein
MAFAPRAETEQNSLGFNVFGVSVIPESHSDHIRTKLLLCAAGMAKNCVICDS